PLPPRLRRPPQSALFPYTTLFRSPVPPLRFEASVRSLEPKNSRAAEALQAIMAEMPTRWEPVLAIVHARDAQELNDDWQRITAQDRKSTRLNSSHLGISYAVFCLK